MLDMEYAMVDATIGKVRTGMATAQKGDSKPGYRQAEGRLDDQDRRTHRPILTLQGSSMRAFHALYEGAPRSVPAWGMPVLIGLPIHAVSRTPLPPVHGGGCSARVGIPNSWDTGSCYDA